MSNGSLPRVKPHARVLVVEDEPDSATLFSTLMESEGHAAVKAQSGEEAMDLLAGDGDFDLVLLDLVLPGLSGWEVLERIKQDGKLRYVPVVVLSALDDKPTILKALELGAEDFLTKPVDVERMLSRVRVMLRIRSLYEDLIHERSGRQQAQRRRGGGLAHPSGAHADQDPVGRDQRKQAAPLAGRGGLVHVTPRASGLRRLPRWCLLSPAP